MINFFPQLIPEKYLSPLSKVAPDDLQFFEAPEGSGTLTENERKAGILALSEHLAMVYINSAKIS